ncbi:hypothetical protein JCM11251_002072 [Rhodosporidiobolus azoricus]
MLRYRNHPLLSFALAFLALLVLSFLILAPSFDSPSIHNALWAPGSVGRGGAAGAGEMLARQRAEDPNGGQGTVAEGVKHGGVIMPKLPNATAKAELGRASWKLLHTMAARFPENPTADEREAFKSYLFLFSRLYPCGECAAEFQSLLRRFPPQTSSRSTASMYLCHLHNQVNARLGKPEFDCSADLEGVYDCGCGGLDEDELDVGEKGRIGTGTGKGGKGEVKRKEEEVEEEEETVKEVKEQRPAPLVGADGKRRDPETGLELIGG